MPFLKRFALNWASGRLLQTLFNNKRSYAASKGNPESYRYRRRLDLVLKAEGEHDQRLEEGVFDEGRTGGLIVHS